MSNTLFVVSSIVILVLAIAIVSFAPQQTPAPAVEKDSSGFYLIHLSDFSFKPQNINISIGESIKWINEDSVMHSITSDSTEPFSSASLGAGDSFTYTFNKKGVYEYHCGVHPQMTGKITVN